jgi:HD superfamily phosphodiesterase
MNTSTFKSRLILFTSILCLTAFCFTGTSCRLLKHDPQAKVEKKQKAEEKKINKEYEKALKEHYKHQSKGAKMMMKQTKKKASIFNRPMKRKHNTKNTCS